MTTSTPSKRSLPSLLALMVSLLVVTVARGQQNLSNAKDWTLHPSHEAVQTTLAPTAKRDGFTLSYNFTGGSGYVIARHALEVDLPENYEVSFTLSGTGPSNDLEVKLLDAPDGKGSKLGDSIWWVKRRNFEWSQSPTRVNSKAKHFSFAWGPLNGAKIKRLGAVEIVVASSSGGAGTITVTDVQFRPLPPSRPYTGKPVATASSSHPGSPASRAIDEDPTTAWLDDDNVPPELTVDFGAFRDFDALRIDWASPVAQYTVEAADHPEGPWRRLWSAAAQTPVARSYTDIPDTTARLLRIGVPKTGAAAVGVADLRFLTRPPVAGAETLGVWPLIAADVPTHAMPRCFTGRQSSWTVLGVPNSAAEALINEEGTVEPWAGGPSLVPVVTDSEGRLVQFTADGPPVMLEGAPVPVVSLHSERFSLKVTAFVYDIGGEDGETLFIRYDLQPRGVADTGTFHVLVRPFQVNPPWQFLNTVGGVGSIRTLERAPATKLGEYPFDVILDGARRIEFPAYGQPSIHYHAFADGEAGVRLASTDATADLPDRPIRLTDPHAAASVRWSVRFPMSNIPELSWVVGVPLRSTKRHAMVDAGGATANPLAVFDWHKEKVLKRWRTACGPVIVSLPPGNEQLAASIKASLAYILVNRDGAGFQPGSRSYERSWIRDGALTSAALLEFGLTDEVKQFVDWYAGFQFPTGAIPCVVDKRGADPVVENDSHGQFIYALAEHHRYTRDDTFLLKHFGAVEKAVAHIQAELAKRKTAEYSGNATRAEPGKPPVPLKAFYGLMPESISHEGYSSKPMHSYWDDFFTLKGLRDAAEIARVLEARAKKDGRGEAAVQFGRREKEWAGAAAEFAGSLRASIEATRAAHRIHYIPGCVELGDFDATSTTIAINPCGALNDLPRGWYDATFDRWWAFFVARRDGTQPYVDYTPYEWRIVGTLVMLGHRDRAWESTKWYLQDQLPPRKTGDTFANGWLHWAEIVHHDRGAGKWIGDMPHTWVASDFLRSIRTMFVYEEPSPSPARCNLVLFAGVPAEWAEAPEGVSFTGLRTPFGTLNASLRKKDGWYILHYDGLEPANLPYRVRFSPPVAWPPREIEVLEGGGAKNDTTGGIDGVTTGMTVRFR